MASSKNIKNIKKKRKKNPQKTIISNKRKKQKYSLFLNVNIYILILLVLVLMLLVYNTYILNKSIEEISKNVERLELNQMQKKEMNPHYVFIGDSITDQYQLSEYFKGYSVVNSGVSGDTTEGIIKNMEERVYRYNPSTVFLMIGTNDVIENKSTEYIFNNIKEIVQEIQINLPNTKIVVESIIPSQENWSDADKNEKREEINKLLNKEYINNDVVAYVDLYSLLEDKTNKKLNDKYTTDGLHLNSLAYDLISKELKKYMTMKNR